MTTIDGIAEAVLYVTDLERATRFYTDVIGLPLTAAFGDARFLQTGEYSTLILFDIEALEKRVSIIPGHGARGRGHVALAIAADQLEAWRERLVAHGVEIEHEQVWSLGTRSLYFRDPDDNSLELIENHHYPTIWQRITSAE
jgi:catechol 2,3-dioxygenase-like lactoylglutathione lyase family enzyme